MKIYELHKLRALRKQAFIKRCSEQALAAKRQLIENGKGSNGLTMNKALLEKHFAIR